MADQDILTYTGLCYGCDGLSWCLSDSQGPAKGPSFQVSDIGCLLCLWELWVGMRWNRDPPQLKAHSGDGGEGRSCLG